jgi:N-methylhydantoinase A/oxoprolinase/acetone carboxylase beta subunit
LQVGPESAGARPGPIAYGRGGTAVTVTDTNLLLGRLNPDRLTGVEDAAPMEAIAAAIHEQIGAPLGLDVIGAAAAILAVTTNQLAHAIRLVSVEKGHDPRDFAGGGTASLLRHSGLAQTRLIGSFEQGAYLRYLEISSLQAGEAPIEVVI